MKDRFVCPENKQLIANSVQVMINEPTLLKAWLKDMPKNGWPTHTIGKVKQNILKLGGYVD